MPARWLSLFGWAMTFAAAALYVVMLTTTLPHLAALAGGLTMFDLRAGYDLETARTILERLGAEGRDYYAAVQHPLDSFYPPFLALAVIYWLWLLAPRWRRVGWKLANPVLWGFMAIAALAAVFDLAENALVAGMLNAGPEGLTAGLVDTASGFTLAKTVAVSISETVLLVLIVGPFIPRVFGRKG